MRSIVFLEFRPSHRGLYKRRSFCQHRLFNPPLLDISGRQHQNGFFPLDQSCRHRFDVLLFRGHKLGCCQYNNVLRTPCQYHQDTGAAIPIIQRSGHARNYRAPGGVCYIGEKTSIEYTESSLTSNTQGFNVLSVIFAQLLPLLLNVLSQFSALSFLLVKGAFDKVREP